MEVAEKQLELRAGGAEFGGRGKRKIELQTAGEQKNPVDGGSAGEVEQVNGVELGGEAAGPILEHVRQRDVVGNGKGQVEIRPTVRLSEGERTDEGAGEEAGIGGGELEQAVAAGARRSATLNMVHPGHSISFRPLFQTKGCRLTVYPKIPSFI